MVGDDVAAELARLQATVAPDPRASRRRWLSASWCGVRLLRLVRPGADGVGVGRAGAPGDVPDGTAVAVKVLHDGVEHRVLRIRAMEAIAAYLENEDLGSRSCDPS
jgi:hypothetical protein